MSAIFGIHTGGTPANLAEMHQLRDHLARRGPDASGIWSELGVALGNCLLRTTPESLHEDLPASDVDGVYCITADARLDNRDDLIAQLDLDSSSASNLPDSTLILEAYRQWGEACPAHLLGDFAFAIWNRQTRTLFCARDPFGVKPFYYARVGHRFAFCSCIDGLLKLKWVPRRLNELRVASHLTTFFGDTTATFYSDILRLPPGHSMWVGNCDVRLSKYYTLRPDELRLKSDAEYVDAFRTLFAQAVRTRLRSAGRIGSMLSGGLDSSSIAAVAGQQLAEEGRGPLASFSAVFDSVPRSNERPFIEAMVERGGFEPAYLAADQCDPFLAPPELDGCQPEVHVAANMFLNWGLYGMAKERGVRVMLDGFDGDSTVSHGVGYLVHLARRRQWLELTRLIPAAARACDRTAPGLWWSHVWHLGIAPNVPPTAFRIGRGAARRWRWIFSQRQAEAPCDCVLERSFTERIGLREYRASLGASMAPAASSELESHYQTLMWGVMPATLEMLDQAAAPFGIELRFPFWDRRLIEFCLALPARFKIRAGFTRWILRQAMEGILPREVQWRPGKASIGPAFKHCLLKHGRSTLEQAADQASVCLRPYLCLPHLKRARVEFSTAAGDREALFLWQTANLARWIQRTGIRA